jgi:hypothetical protein
MKTYNINELLERKKHLEQQLLEKMQINPTELVFQKDIIIDRKNEKNNRESTPRAKISLTDFSLEVNSLADELAKTRTAIQKYNAGDILQLLQSRTALRQKIEFLQGVKSRLPRDRAEQRIVLSADRENNPIEIKETVREPMFNHSDLDKVLNQFAAEERKLNTEIQKKNLNAEVNLDL